MPILAKETDLFPNNLLQQVVNDAESDRLWWALYTRSRREKQLMRNLLAKEIPFYGPVVRRRFRSPSGRLRTSYVPLFANYVFMYGDEIDRQDALISNCISRSVPVSEGAQLSHELLQIHDLIERGRPLTPEARLTDGHRVRVLSGIFQGFEGMVIRRENETRLLVAVTFMQQGASVLLDDCQLERVD